MSNHLLHPRFFAMPSGVPFEEGDTFELMWYAKIDNYTLVHWRWTSNAPPLRQIPGLPRDRVATEGESLYQGDDDQTAQLLAWAWYELELGEPSDIKAMIAHKSPDPRARVDKAMGSYGLSPSIAAKLRSPETQIHFQF